MSLVRKYGSRKGYNRTDLEKVINKLEGEIKDLRKEIDIIQSLPSVSEDQ